MPYDICVVCGADMGFATFRGGIMAGFGSYCWNELCQARYSIDKLAWILKKRGDLKSRGLCWFDAGLHHGFCERPTKQSDGYCDSHSRLVCWCGEQATHLCQDDSTVGGCYRSVCDWHLCQHHGGQEQHLRWMTEQSQKRELTELVDGMQFCL